MQPLILGRARVWAVGPSQARMIDPTGVILDAHSLQLQKAGHKVECGLQPCDK